MGSHSHQSGKRGIFLNELQEGEFPSGDGRRQGRDKRGVFILMVGGKLHPNRGVGVVTYPIRRGGGLFSPGRGWEGGSIPKEVARSFPSNWVGR